MSYSEVATPPSPTTLPTTGTAFKDWSLICDALGQGRQSLILRKGGIAEGRQGFRFKHDAFFLFPTQYHQQAERIRPEELPTLHHTPPPPEDSVVIRYFFALEWAEWIDDWETVARLAPYHVWREDVARERFEYDDQRGLQYAFGRVYRLDPAWTFPDRPSFGGCRSWITLPEYPSNAHPLTPVLTDAQHAQAAQLVRATLTRL